MGLIIIWGPYRAATLHAWRPVGTLWSTGCGKTRKAPPDKHGDGPRCESCVAWVAREQGRTNHAD